MLKKFIVRAESSKDMIALLQNTELALVNPIRWDAHDICCVGETYVGDKHKILTGEDYLFHYTTAGIFDKVDDAIMGPEVPVGGMVVVCDGKTDPVYGFVCGNGNSWYIVDLTVDLQNAIMDKFDTVRKYGVNLAYTPKYRKVRWFDTKDELKGWLTLGLAFCEGAEAEHYEHMLAQYEDGKTVVNYYEF